MQKHTIADLVKEAVRDTVATKLRELPGIERVRVDVADSLQCHVLVTDAHGTQAFRVKVSEVQ